MKALVIKDGKFTIPPTVAKSEEDFVDMTFGIDNYRLENGYWLMKISAIYNNHQEAIFY
jgi:hypothetical protein